MEFKDFYGYVLNSSIESYDEIPYKVEKVHFKKGDIITRYGQVEDSIYYMNNGIVEMSIKSYMSEKVIDFFFNNELFCGFTSFLKQEPTDVQIVALVDSTIERIQREGLYKAYETSFAANKFGRICTEHGYIRKSDREKELLTKTAEERYAELFRTKSQYISQIPVNKVAKYLGIHPESLSRIRKKMSF